MTCFCWCGRWPSGFLDPVKARCAQLEDEVAATKQTLVFWLQYLIYIMLFSIYKTWYMMSDMWYVTITWTILTIPVLPKNSRWIPMAKALGERHLHSHLSKRKIIDQNIAKKNDAKTRSKVVKELGYASSQAHVPVTLPFIWTLCWIQSYPLTQRKATTPTCA